MKLRTFILPIPFCAAYLRFIAELEGKGRVEFAGTLCISMFYGLSEPDWTFAPKAGSRTALLWKGGF